MAKEVEIHQARVERYYPNVLAGAKEFQAIAAAENPELNALWQKAWKWYLNTFARKIDEQGAARWEKMLKLWPKANDTLEDRRRAILVKINTMLPYTYRRMEQILISLCGESLYEIDLDHVAGTLSIVTNADKTQGMNEISGMLRPIIPANLALNLVMEIMQQWRIQQRAACTALLEARQRVWNLGSAKFVRRNGAYRRDGTTRRSGIAPDGGYRTAQQHRAEAETRIETRMEHSGQILNRRDGSHCRDGSHRRNGGYRAQGQTAHCCTMAYIKNGIEVMENV